MYICNKYIYVINKCNKYIFITLCDPSSWKEAQPLLCNE